MKRTQTRARFSFSPCSIKGKKGSNKPFQFVHFCTTLITNGA